MKSIHEYIEEFINLFPGLTKEEVDITEKVLNWEDEKKIGFMMAKRIFEQKDE